MIRFLVAAIVFVIISWVLEILSMRLVQRTCMLPLQKQQRLESFQSMYVRLAY